MICRQFVAIIVVALVLTIFAGRLANAQDTSDKLVMYVSEGCSHCLKVEQFIARYQLSPYVTIKNVTLDGESNIELVDYWSVHEVPRQDRGTPFGVLPDGSWVVGDTPLIEYLKSQHGIEDDGTDIIPEEPGESSVQDVVILVFGGAIVLCVVGYGIFKIVNERSTKR